MNPLKVAVLVACLYGASGMSPGAAGEIQIPKQSDWTEQGVIARPGVWDARLVGGFSPCGVVKKDGTYFVYYIGSSGGRSDDNGPAYRALGVITSTDGVNFNKYSKNPIITHWEPAGHRNQQEAGIFTCAAVLDGADILLYVGAMTVVGPNSVNDDGKLYASHDGVNFSLVTTVLDHTDASLWKSGDEVDPLGVFKHPKDGSWHMYYSANVGNWPIGYQRGTARDNWNSGTSGPVINSGADSIGGADPILVNSETVVLFIDRADGNPKWSHWFTEVRTASVDSPQNLSSPVEIYDFTDTMGTTVFLDRDVDKWLMFYNNGTEQFTDNAGFGTVISLRTAPFIQD